MGEGEGEPLTTCADALAQGLPSGATVLDDGSIVECDQVTAGGGWALIVRYVDGDACLGGWETAPFGGCRRPNAAPRNAGGAMSATMASRGAPRMPLPTRSIKRAVSTKSTEAASANSGFEIAPSP